MLFLHRQNGRWLVHSSMIVSAIKTNTASVGLCILMRSKAPPRTVPSLFLRYLSEYLELTKLILQAYPRGWDYYYWLLITGTDWESFMQSPDGRRFASELFYRGGKKKFADRKRRQKWAPVHSIGCKQLFWHSELLGPRAPIILAKENNCLQHIGRVRARVCPRLRSLFLQSILAWRIGISWRLISCPPRIAC